MKAAIGTVREEIGRQNENLSWNDVGRRVIEWMQIDVGRVNWFSTNRVHHRVADHFRYGRAFLICDAASARDKSRLEICRRSGQASASLLDSYEPERIAVVRRLVATTDPVFMGVTSSGAIARRVQLNIVPFVLPFLFKFAIMRRLNVSNYFTDRSELPGKQV